MDNNRTKRLKGIVELGGGEWVGIQEGMDGIPALILFNSPQTGCTLAVDEELLIIAGAEAIRNKIEKSNTAFASARIPITRVVFDQLVQNLKSCLELLAKESK